MCIAIVKKKNAKISDEYLKNCFEHNKDGAGIAYAHGGKLYVLKGIFDEEKFIKAVRQAEKISDGAMLIHCRIGTHGLKDKNNCHPHIVNNKCVLIHNGVLSVDMPLNSDESDTIWFIRKYLKPLAYDFMKDDTLCELISMAIRTNNKFALLNNKGEYKIINEDSGHWEKDVWYSNYSYQSPKTTYITPTKTIPEWKNNIKYPLFNQQIKEPVVDEEKIIENIQNLDDADMINMGEYPVIDLVTLKLLPETDETITDSDRYRYLDDVSDTAYEEYCYEIEIRGLMNEILGEDAEAEEETELKNAG